MAKNYYKILGLTNVASEADIKKGYYKMALKYHPDKNQSSNANEQFKLIAEAYEVLSDAEKRKTYDSYQNNSGFRSEKWQYDFRKDPMQMFYEVFRNVSLRDIIDFPKEAKLTILEFFELTEKRNTDTQSIGSDAENQPDHNASAPNNVPNAQVIRDENQDTGVAARQSNFNLLFIFRVETDSVEMLEKCLNNPTVKFIIIVGGISILFVFVCSGLGIYNVLTSIGQGIVHICNGISWGATLGSGAGGAMLFIRYILPFF